MHGETDPYVEQKAIEMQPYSGLSPYHYSNFVSKLEIVSNTLDPDMLYSSLGDLEILTDYVPAGDSGAIDHISRVCLEIGSHYEKLILNKALQQGHPFMPKYLTTTLN